MPLPQTTQPPHQRVRSSAGIGGVLGLVALLALLAGCSLGRDSPQPHIPTGQAGQTCSARCDLQKTQCQQRQQVREQGCNQHYTSALADYALCVKERARNCRAPYTCLGADLEICERQYQPCLTTCTERSERQANPGGAATPAAETVTTPALDPPTPPAPKTAPTPRVDRAPPPSPKVEKTGGAAG